jgi:hypothetical protein
LPPLLALISFVSEITPSFFRPAGAFGSGMNVIDFSVLWDCADLSVTLVTGFSLQLNNAKARMQITIMLIFFAM